MLLAIGSVAATLEKRFRFYSMATMVILVAFGALTALDAPRIDANLPTLWVGVWELIASVFSRSVVVLAIALLRVRDPAASGACAGSEDSTSVSEIGRSAA